MNNVSKNKLLTGLVLLLLLANAITIAMIWLNKTKHPPKGTPKDYLIKELQLDAKQQAQFEVLVKEHQQASAQFREQAKEAKETLFDLLKLPNVTDSIKQSTAKKVSVATEALDLLTLNHFQKVRALCNPDQQKKFDTIIEEVVRMMGQPRPPMRPGDDPGGPPLHGPGGDMPPPPRQ